jgi:hypothetical protein
MLFPLREHSQGLRPCNRASATRIGVQYSAEQAIVSTFSPPIEANMQFMTMAAKTPLIGRGRLRRHADLGVDGGVSVACGDPGASP